jgi:hypothetical protein
VNKWSPRIDGLFSFGEPFFARTSTLPGWVPGGICSSFIPSTVCTCLDVKNSIISVWIQHTNKKLRGKKKRPSRKQITEAMAKEYHYKCGIAVGLEVLMHEGCILNIHHKVHE